MHSKSGSDDEAAANLAMTELLDLLASAIPKDTAAGKCNATHLFFERCSPSVPVPKKHPLCRPLKSLSASRDAAGFEAHLVSPHTPH